MSLKPQSMSYRARVVLLTVTLAKFLSGQRLRVFYQKCNPTVNG